jgi:hypothetical protein
VFCVLISRVVYLTDWIETVNDSAQTRTAELELAQTDLKSNATEMSALQIQMSHLMTQTQQLQQQINQCQQREMILHSQLGMNDTFLDLGQFALEIFRIHIDF